MVTREVRFNRTCGQQPGSESGGRESKKKGLVIGIQGEGCPRCSREARDKGPFRERTGQAHRVQKWFLALVSSSKGQEGNTTERPESLRPDSHLSINPLCILMHANSLSY